MKKTKVENENQLEIYRRDFLDKENEELIKQEKKYKNAISIYVINKCIISYTKIKL